MVEKNKEKLLKFRGKRTDFPRKRALILENTIGLVLWMTLSRNQNGYDISSQNFFRELSQKLNEDIDPAKKQSVSSARTKLNYRAFEYLLHQANVETAGLPACFSFKSHVTRAADGTSFHTQRSDNLLQHFSPRHTKSEEGETHYPYGLMVAAVNVYTGQPVAAEISDYRVSERTLLIQLLSQFKAGDLTLLDRGLGGKHVYLEFKKRDQFFVRRAKTTGERVALYIQEFLYSEKKQHVVSVSVVDPETKKQENLELRLILGPTDSEGKPIVFVTNLLDREKYGRLDILKLYQTRWSIETLYGRVKKLLQLEKVHGKTYNGVMQEIFANLLILSLTSAVFASVVEEDQMDPKKRLPSFKNAVDALKKRNLFAFIDVKKFKMKVKRLVKRLMNEVRQITYKIRHGRRYPRVSMQPIESWNLKKHAKRRAFQKTASLN